MAKCDRGYLCQVCGTPVEELDESELYLRYVVGWVDPEVLHTTPDRHLTCSPTIAQFIQDPDFPTVICEGPFNKVNLDPKETRRREELLTRGWRRLRELRGSSVPIIDYPLPEVIARRSASNDAGGG